MISVHSQAPDDSTEHARPVEQCAKEQARVVPQSPSSRERHVDVSNQHGMQATAEEFKRLLVQRINRANGLLT